MSSNSSLVIFWILPGAIFLACMAFLPAETFLQKMKMGAVQPRSLWNSSTRFMPASSTIAFSKPQARFMSDITLIPLPSHFTIHPNSFIQYSAVPVEVSCTNSYRERSSRSQMALFSRESGQSSTHMKTSRSNERGVGTSTTHTSSKSALTSMRSTKKQLSGIKTTSSLTPVMIPTSLPLSDLACRMVQLRAGGGGREAGLAWVERKDWMQMVSPRFSQNYLKRSPGNSRCVTPMKAGMASRLRTSAEQQVNPCNSDGVALQANFSRQISRRREEELREQAWMGWQKAASPSPNFSFRVFTQSHFPSASFTPASFPRSSLIAVASRPAAGRVNSGAALREGLKASRQQDLMTQQLISSLLKTDICSTSLIQCVGRSRWGPTSRAQVGRASGTKAVRNCSTRISRSEKQLSRRQSLPCTRTQSIFLSQKRIILETDSCSSSTSTKLTRLKFRCSSNSPISCAFSISTLLRMRIWWSRRIQVSASICFLSSRTSCFLSNLKRCSRLVLRRVTTMVCSAICTTSRRWQFLMSWMQSAMLSWSRSSTLLSTIISCCLATPIIASARSFSSPIVSLSAMLTLNSSPLAVFSSRTSML